MQLDIFDHSRDIQLRNDLTEALLLRDPAAARTAWAALSQEYPRDDTLPPAAVLVDTLAQRSEVLFTHHESAGEARHALTEQVKPAALRVLGASDGAAWLVPLWRTLAQRATRLPFDPQRSDEHAAPLWLRAGQWVEASEAVARIESWRRIPAPLSWMTEACYRQRDLDGIWDLLAELAWLSPQRVDAVLQAIADPLLLKLRATFESTFDGGAGVEDLCWLPAWLLTEKPSLAPLLAMAQRGTGTPPEQAMRLLLELLGLERQGRQHEVVQRRKTLRDSYPPLYVAYIAKR